MSSYIDSKGFYHDKLCIDGEPSSNNKFIYTAYARRFGLVENMDFDNKEIMHCWFYKVRHSHKPSSPISRDEILGMVYLKHWLGNELDDWNFSPYPLPKFNLFKFIYQLYKCYGKHRNYFWQNNLLQVGHVAFKVPLQDRYSILKWSCQKIPWYYKLITFFDKRIKSSNRSSIALRSLKYNLDGGKGIADYFTSGHPINQSYYKGGHHG